MNIKSKKILIVMIAAILSIIAIPNGAHAGLQANKGGTSLVKTTANNFFIAIRKMETQYGTLGKNAILDTMTYLDSTENGIDCHMALNTEFGTVGILAYSEYGMLPTQSNDTTTGNSSGIYQLGYGEKEYVAGIFTSTNNYTNAIGEADNRYFNEYSSNNPINGDGMGIFGFAAKYPSIDNPILRRGGGILYVNNDNNGTYGIYASSLASSRAVIVCGTGL